MLKLISTPFRLFLAILTLAGNLLFWSYRLAPEQTKAAAKKIIAIIEGKCK